MEQKTEDKGVQIRCPLCGKQFPVRVKELDGRVSMSVRCPGCKRISEIVLQDIR